MARPAPDLGQRVDGAVGRALYELKPEAGVGTADTLPLTGDEQRLLASVDTYLDLGRELKEWWRRVFPDGFRERFELSRSQNRPDRSFGFFDAAPIGGARMRLMGNYQHMFYDLPKPYSGTGAARGEWMNRQMREFALRYFMRVSDFREPEVEASSEGGQPPAWLRPVSLCRSRRVQKIGFGFSQLFYKLAGGGVGRFAPEQRSAIVDLRRIGREYEWIVVKVRIFDFSFSYEPFGAAGPSFALPLSEESYLVLSREFISDRAPSEVEPSGRYGVGYAFLKNPNPGLLAYGPGDFDAAIELIDFFVAPDGRVRVAMVFVANRPRRILDLSLDPMQWARRLAQFAGGGRLPEWLAPLDRLARSSPLGWLSVDPVYGGIAAANLASGGLARRLLCLSRRTLEEEFLIKHFMQHYQTVAGSLHTWRQVPDWLDEEALPDWALQGV